MSSEREEMRQGEDAPNPGDAGGTSRCGGGAPPPPAALTTTEEGFTEVNLRAEISDYENYDEYISSDGSILDHLHTSHPFLDKNDGNSGDSGGQELGDKELLEALFFDFNKEYDIFGQKIILLCQKYEFFRRTARDGNCFYRAFIFSYLEHISDIQDGSERINELNHLRQCVENTRQAYEIFDSPPIAEATFLAACNDSEYLLDLIESGISAGGLYLTDCKDKMISRILPLLRFLVMIELCTREDFYYYFVCCEGDESIYEFCLYEVIPDKTEAGHIQITALVNALGVPLIVENLDTSYNGVVKLNQTALCPRPDVQVSEVKEFELQSSETCSSSSTSSGERTVADLSPAERRRLVTLLYRPGHYDILYPK